MASRSKKEETVFPKTGNKFAALDMSDSDSEADDSDAPVSPGPAPAPAPAPLPPRTWKLSPQEEARVRENPPRFSSRSKPKESASNGWTTIQWNKPQFKDDESISTCSEKEIQKEVEEEVKEAELEEVEIPNAPSTQEFPSLLKRGSAQMWAEKIKASLDRAEASRPAPSMSKATEDFVEGLGRLSFFRRPLENSS